MVCPDLKLISSSMSPSRCLCQMYRCFRDITLTFNRQNQISSSLIQVVTCAIFEEILLRLQHFCSKNWIDRKTVYADGCCSTAAIASVGKHANTLGNNQLIQNTGPILFLRTHLTWQVMNDALAPQTRLSNCLVKRGFYRFCLNPCFLASVINVSAQNKQNI